MANKHAAEMLMNSNYPEDVRKSMDVAFHAEQYDEVMRIAAAHDVIRRERLDSKIHLVVPSRETMSEIKDAVSEFRAVAAGKMQCKYTAEGIDGEFNTAEEAITAYKRANNIAVTDTSKHKLKRKHFIPDPTQPLPYVETPDIVPMLVEADEDLEKSDE